MCYQGAVHFSYGGCRASKDHFVGNWDDLQPWEDKVRSALSAGEVQRAMEPLAEGYQPVVVGFCVTMLGDPTQGEEVAQEVFMTAYRALPRFRWDSSLLTFMLAIARKRCLKHLKRDGMRKKKFDQKRDEIVENTQRGGQDPLADDPLVTALDLEQAKLDKKGGSAKN
jgi:DNA-directed RNA polymerase specialized sigma24 family protein